ncbi:MULTISPECIES: hypothetical protein [Sphingobium]|uniref:His-Xaa-Ser system protein HsxD n=2 Tax=Sphingobium TaxID=165695 RepID=T0GWV3_9SPHN|nr:MULTISPECIES: hypothetical protein [Sphingobium]AMK26216.1 radical SAM pair-associated protein [Sphingobium sp. TKS]EQB05167.1 hypothetical protein L485_03345 [Sphingobium baderi LL03]KKW89498.1 hypothetical protein YP76_24920 [Sphingobium chungbukense]KMS59051.1 hypothetical protein V475_20660 [Sphingobium baderi LL03]
MNSLTGEARTVQLSRAVFSVEAVKRASYSLMALYDVSVTLSDDDIVCTLTPATKASPMETAERDFRREVVDQDLRISIEQRTEAYRDTILGLAFSRTGLQDG